MPRCSPHLVKSAIRLVRQSTTVPNTSNTSAFTAETSDMVAPFVVFWSLSSSFRDAPPGAGPESILTMVLMDSLMCNCTSKLGLRAPRNDDLVDGAARSIQMEFVQLPMLGLDVAHGAGDRAHHHGLSLD